MKTLRKVLNSKFIERFKRQLALKSGIYCKIKVLAPGCSEELRTARLLQEFKIDKVYDIGANTGQFAESLIDFGFKGEIISFEPVSSAREALIKRANKYAQWSVAKQCAIGDRNGRTVINVSEVSQFSSIKKIKDDFTVDYNTAKVVKTEDIDICTLDSFKEQYIKAGENVLIKIDTQGFEKEVLKGAEHTLKIATGIIMEIPLSCQTEIYEGIEWDIHDYLAYFKNIGFKCYSLSAINANKVTGIVTEVDGIFFRDLN